MLDKKIVFNGIEMLCINFSIDKTKKEIKTFCRSIYPILESESVTNEEFGNAIVAFMKKTKGSNFNKIPSVGDFLAIIGKAPKDPEQLAQEQAMLVWEGGYTYADKVIFDNPTTNYIIEHSFGGLSNFRWKYLNSQNENIIGDNWGRKEFVSAWVTAYKVGKEKKSPLCSDASRIDSKIKVIGNPEKVVLMLENKPENNKTNESVKLLSEKMKI
jgi:hypothetical protein